MIQCAFRRLIAVRALKHMRQPRFPVPSLSSTCFKAVARGVMNNPKLFPPEKLKRKLPKHMKELLAQAFMEDVEGLSEKFKQAVPGIAWNDDIEDLSFTEARPTAADLDMMMFFCSSAEKLVRLNLTWNKYDMAGVKCLAKFIRENSTIRKLELSWNCLGPSIAAPMVESLYKNATVTLLDLAGNNLGVEGMVAVKEMMKENESITDLNLGFNEIGVQGTKQICETIKTSCSLVKLNLRFNELGPEGGALIVDALRFNDGTLKAIVMTDNHIGAKTASAITRIVKGGVAQRLAICGYPNSINNRKIRVISNYQPNREGSAADEYQSIELRDRLYPAPEDRQAAIQAPPGL